MAAAKDLEIVDNSKKKWPLLVGIAAGVLLLLVGAFVIFYMMGSEDTSNTEGAVAYSEDGTPVRPAGPAGEALYVQMPRPFVFNVVGANRDRLVQIRVQLLVRGPNNETLAQRHIPLIEGTLLKTFSSANADDLVTTMGKESLKNKALSDLQEAMIDVVGTVVVEEVLFTGFVMQ
ncbi:flagellar basal body-associated protein FliL [Arsukibacterium sp.]|uniref:flagellar basal body-associated protein FliL n=1 Tax=Arsukibacterium sp. TaxID=1977258 RepID=UPI002FDA932A